MAQDVMPPLGNWEGESEKLLKTADAEWATPFEISGYIESPDYQKTMNWLNELCESSEILRSVVIGKSAQGREIRMIIASGDGLFSAEEIAASEVPVLLVQAGIHSGEIDGKDAGMMLLRDMAHGNKKEILENSRLLFIPILNTDGHERRSRYGRVNQRGPREMGWRTNSRNLNLNRDYSKMETEGIQAVIGVINQYDPDLYIDVHVTDGADYQYDITYGYTGDTGYSPAVEEWLEKSYRTEIDRVLADHGHIPGPLLFARNGKDFSDGNVEFAFSPRFSNAYGDARHLPTVLIENHSLKPFRRRVLGTYVLIEGSLRLLTAEKEQLRAAIESDKNLRPQSLVLEYGYNPTASDTILFRGIKSRARISDITGRSYVEWLGEPMQKEIPVFRMNKPMKEVSVPKAYWIPAQWQDIINKLKTHGIKMETTETMVEKELEQDSIQRFALATSPYEGRVRYSDFEITPVKRKVRLPAGSVRVPADQPLGELAALLLEPGSPDSFFQWGYLHQVLSRTEYIESYIMEPMAAKMLKNNEDLKTRFLEKKEKDSSFANDPDAIFRWFYTQTPYMDKEWNLIPVYREW
ncbi:M14 family metallopeptidase [Robertkochia aurantiaca]|uniref:M14 family metallopeptidase n=1 Tax=Robertkochia aurantiaca TaxID=2873700 RepID=UPI001CCBBC93|nr:M14 family metallopeptidase [Robertkochia sp. 3YJGBD-33]